MAKETKDGKAKAPKEPVAEVPSEVAAENGNVVAEQPLQVAAFVEAELGELRRRVRLQPAVADLVKRHRAYQTPCSTASSSSGEGGGPEFENSHWNDR